MAAEFSNIKSFFSSNQVHFSDLWLENCINWCKTEALTSNYTPQQLQSKVFEQWLLSNLHEIESRSLPPDLSTKRKFTLNGNFCLQMMQIVDISKPKLWQLQKIRNSNVLTRDTQQDSEVAGTGKRVLQMRLTDGVQEIEAMEYQPVPSLSLNLPPGIKIRIIGPVVIRRGRLMLQEKNVKVLGGEVEELLVSNAAENILAKCLKLPQNPSPNVIEEKLLVVEKEDKNEGYVSNVKFTKQQPPPPLKPSVELTEEEQLLMAEEFGPADDLFKSGDFEPPDFDNINNSCMSTQKPPDVSLDDDQDVFENLDIDAHLDAIDHQMEPQPLPKPKITTIAKLMEMRNSITRGVFKINAQFKTVEQKLSLAEGEFKLVIKVEDSSGELIAKVHSDVVGEFAGYSAAAILDLRNNVIAKEQAAVEKMKKALLKVKEELVKLDGVLSVQIEKNQIPIIIKISQ